MPTTPRSQMALAADPNFQQRLASLLVSEAQVVAAQPAPPPPTPPDPPDQAAIDLHARRRQLAQAVITNPTGMAQSLGPTICNGTNLVAATTSFNFEAGAAETSATDAEIRSQISTLWNVMAGA